MPQNRFTKLFLFVLSLFLVYGAFQFLLAESFHFPQLPDSVRFAVIGDMGSGREPQYEVAQRMTQQHADFPFTFVLMLGDNLNTGHGPHDYEKDFNMPYKPLLDNGVKFFASLGNHDNVNERVYAPFHMGGESYYTFQQGNVRFFALDSNYMDAQQLDWLQKQLQSAGDNNWKICFFHHPLYSTAKQHGPATDLRLLLEPLFIKYHVDVVFSGHEHVYERFQPQHGIYYFVEGSSGELRPGNLRPASQDVAAGFDSDRTFLLVQISGKDMYFEALSRTGATVDSGDLPRQAPAAFTQP